MVSYSSWIVSTSTKNRSAQDARLFLLHDVVTTAIYRYTQYAGGPELEDRTLALRLFRKSKTKGYPLPAELQHFGRAICGAAHPAAILQRIAQGLSETLNHAKIDARIPKQTLKQMRVAWEDGLAYGAT